MAAQCAGHHEYQSIGIAQCICVAPLVLDTVMPALAVLIAQFTIWLLVHFHRHYKQVVATIYRAKGPLRMLFRPHRWRGTTESCTIPIAIAHYSDTGFTSKVRDTLGHPLAVRGCVI